MDLYNKPPNIIPPKKPPICAALSILMIIRPITRFIPIVFIKPTVYSLSIFFLSINAKARSAPISPNIPPDAPTDILSGLIIRLNVLGVIHDIKYIKIYLLFHKFVLFVVLLYKAYTCYMLYVENSHVKMHRI